MGGHIAPYFRVGVFVPGLQAGSGPNDCKTFMSGLKQTFVTCQFNGTNVCFILLYYYYKLCKHKTVV